jgi:hypothetical protein
LKTKFVLLFFLTISIVTAQNNAIKISGFSDVYYAYNFNEPSDQNIPLAYNHSRHNEVNVNNLLLGFKSNTERVRANAVFLQVLMFRPITVQNRLCFDTSMKRMWE